MVDQGHATPTTHFGAWQESEDLHLAKVLSFQQSEDAIQRFSSSSSSSAAASSSNSSSSSSAAAPKRALQKKVPRWPLSDFQKPAASAAAAMPAAMPAAPVLKSNASQKQGLAQAAREEDEKNKSKGFKNKTLSDVQRQPLQPIQEQPMVATSYFTPSGCMEIMFNQDDDNVARNLCPTHGRDTYPKCRDCANYEFMIAKRRHEIAEQSALELSLDNSKIVGPVGNRQCSKHGEDFKEDCQSCINICDLRGGNA